MFGFVILRFGFVFFDCAYSYLVGSFNNENHLIRNQKDAYGSNRQTNQIQCCHFSDQGPQPNPEAYIYIYIHIYMYIYIYIHDMIYICIYIYISCHDMI